MLNLKRVEPEQWKHCISNFQNWYLEKWVFQIWLTLLRQNGISIQGFKMVQILPTDGTELVPSEHHKGTLTSPTKDSSDAKKSLAVLHLKQNDLTWDRGRQMKFNYLRTKPIWEHYFSLPPNYYWRVLHLHLYNIKIDVVFSNLPAKLTAQFN